MLLYIQKLIDKKIKHVTMKKILIAVCLMCTLHIAHAQDNNTPHEWTSTEILEWMMQNADQKDFLPTKVKRNRTYKTAGYIFYSPVYEKNGKFVHPYKFQSPVLEVYFVKDGQPQHLKLPVENPVIDWENTFIFGKTEVVAVRKDEKVVNYIPTENPYYVTVVLDIDQDGNDHLAIIL